MQQAPQTAAVSVQLRNIHGVEYHHFLGQNDWKRHANVKLVTWIYLNSGKYYNSKRYLRISLVKAYLYVSVQNVKVPGFLFPSFDSPGCCQIPPPEAVPTSLCLTLDH